jgi:hypothetical protein
MTYYSDTTPWKMGGQPIKVVEDNEHLGQLVSGTRQEEKNIDGRLKKRKGLPFQYVRSSLFLQMHAEPTC